MPNSRIFVLFSVFCLTVPLASLRADLKPEEVPRFRLRAHVVTVGGERPDGRKFSFRFNTGGKSSAAEGNAWSDWLPFEREQIEATLKGYPAIYLKGWPWWSGSKSAVLSIPRSSKPS